MESAPVTALAFGLIAELGLNLRLDPDANGAEATGPRRPGLDLRQGLLGRLWSRGYAALPR